MTQRKGSVTIKGDVTSNDPNQLHLTHLMFSHSVLVVWLNSLPPVIIAKPIVMTVLVAPPKHQSVWQAETMNARGQLEKQRFGNGLVTQRAYDPLTGHVQTIQSGIPGSFPGYQ
mgnify:CR=1 FL=1